MPELRVRFHREMDTLERKVTHLFALVAEDLAAATDALLSGEADVMKDLLERELLIDRVHRETEELVTQLVALQAPVSKDLRFFLSILRIVPELERSHDLVLHIARHSENSLATQLTPRARGLVGRMGKVGVEMWNLVGESWHARDRTASAVLEEHDEQMDTLHAALIAEVASGRMPLPVAMEMTLVARFYERLGDHANNIGRRVSYLVGADEAEAARS